MKRRSEVKQTNMNEEMGQMEYKILEKGGIGRF
jgi:hypothetical protein